MVTFRVELASAPNRDGQYPVRLRITAQRQHKRISLGFAINKKDFNPKGVLDKSNWIRATCSQYLLYNNRIREKYEAGITVVSELSKNGNPTIDEVINALTTNKDQSFIEYYKKQLEYARVRLTLKTAENYGVPLNKLIAYLEEKGKKDITFKELTPAWLKDFESFMYRKNVKNTVSKQLGYVQTIINEAIKDKLLSRSNNPFEEYDFTFDPTEREKLTEDEFKELEEMELTPNFRVCHARDIFLFMYYTHGMRIGDALFIKVGNVYTDGKQTRLEYIMQKTGTAKNVLLGEKAKAIIERYREGKKPYDFLFPFLELGKDYKNPEVFKEQKEAKTSIVNNNLKKLQERLGWQKRITCHIARHTFADTARKKGQNTYNISKALGHTRLSTTEQYLKSFDQNSVDSINEIYE
ncbi:site-specific integrase [Runella salmonicolor]|uniref:Site-specific integrase n=1 Tax=Runella salmonicolor TaxID=2950278 RepID=A0ABT1FSY5_9BACT|nr:site-specific integrase [Runella salmonicolor]MCP1384874.1 site-specific integrase [Runella salmonicolor]